MYFRGKACEPFVAHFDVILPIKTTDKNNDIQIFNLDENGFYGEPSTFYGDSTAASAVFDWLKVYLRDLFAL